MANIPTLDALALLFPWLSGVTTSTVAYKIQNWSFRSRYCMGVAVLLVQTQLIGYKFFSPVYKKYLPPMFNDPLKSSYWSSIIQTLTFIQLHGISGIFKGKGYYEKHGITNIKQAMLTGLFSGQVYFGKKGKGKLKILKQFLKYLALFIIARIISFYLLKDNQKLLKFCKKNPFIHYEIFGLLISTTQLNVNLQSYIFGLLLAPDDMELVPPYDFAFIKRSMRDFWKGWSRPVGEMLRYAVYEPLGGRNNNLISTPAVFQVNNMLHWNFSKENIGDKAMKDWTQVFCLLGSAVAFEIGMEVKTKKKYVNEWWWKLAGLITFHSLMLPSLYIMSKKANPRSLESMSNAFLIGNQFGL